MADFFCYPTQPDPSARGPNVSPSSYDHLVACPPPSRQRRSRTMFTDEDVRRLENFFASDPYPDIYAREQLAMDIAVPEARIQTWFQNKRSRTRRQMNGHGRTPPTAPATTGPGTYPHHLQYPGQSPPTGPDHSHYGLIPQCNQENVHPATITASQLLFPGRFAALPAPICPFVSPARPTAQSSFEFRLQPAPAARGGSPRDASSPGSDCERRQVTPPGPIFVPAKRVGNVGTPPNAALASPKGDSNDSGVLDLSLKSNESPKEGGAMTTNSPTKPNSSPTNCLPARSAFRSCQVSPQQPAVSPKNTPHPDAGRPFFTPWASPTTTSTVRASVLNIPPKTAQFPLPPQFSAPNPWMHGFAPSFNSKDGVYYFQPLPNSPLLQHVADNIFPISPGLSPLVSGPGGSPWAISPSLNFRSPAPHHFIFPDVNAASMKQPEVPVANLTKKRRQSPPLPAEVTIVETEQKPKATASPTPCDSRVSSSSSSKADGLNGSPGSDTESRSSGYSSRDGVSPIDVCN